jgi:ribonuclease-3
MEAPLADELGERLGITLRDPELVQQAFVHSSYLNENPGAVVGHNERLEFYGDAVIGLVVSRLLYDRYPDEDEGFLTARRAALVNREALAAMALDLGFDRYLRLGRGESEGGGATRPSLLAASFEALAGAVSLSEGPTTTMAVLARLFEPRLQALSEIDGPPKSAKSRLQEWSQRHHGVKPSYRLVRTSGPPHEQEFEVDVVLDRRRIASGSGSSRQRAEESAARDALEVLDAERSARVTP